MRILYIEDDPGLARLVEKDLARHGHAVETCVDGAAGVARVAQGGIDLVALDHHLPGQDGLTTLGAICALPNAPPVVYVTGSGNSSIAVAALKGGAVDYIAKDPGGEFVTLLRAAIESALTTVSLRRDQKRIEAVLRESEEDYRTLFASAPMAVFVCDRNAVIQKYNPRAVELWDREPVCGVEKHCGSVKLWLPDGNRLPHAQSPIVEVLRTGTAAHNVEVDIERPDGSRVPVLVNFAPLKNAQGEIIGAITAFDDIIEKRQAEERQKLLTRELQHRTKNLLSVIQSIAGRSLSPDRSNKEALEVFTARLHALAEATSLLTEINWEGAPLKDVIVRTLASFSDERVSIDGPPLLLTPSATQSVTLVIHELCTNATKYGAFSTPHGKVAIRWSIDEQGNEPKLLFRWQERGGPRVTPPKGTGFGTTVIMSAISGSDDAPRIEYASEGLRFTLEVPLSAVAADKWLQQQRGGEE